MDYLPLFHDLRDQSCLVVGGGHVALRKLRALCQAGARVSLVAPTIIPAITTLANEYQHLVTCQQRPYTSTDLDNKVLVICATNDGELNAAVSVSARAQRIPVNVVDHPELSTVIFPAIVDRSPIQVAISSGGASPVLVRRLREKIETLLPGRLGELALLASRHRDTVKKLFTSSNDRRRFWETVFDSDIPERVYAGDTNKADTLLKKRLQQAPRSSLEKNGISDNKGEVYLVGAGPGDPDLLTFRALRLMQQADVVLYDRLVSKPVLEMVRRDAERIYVGKKPGDHPVNQSNINRKLVELALEGHRVLRLKGGDPFVFGRGGEEIEVLAEQGISFQIVPGITAATGCASYAGIPLTHRDYAQSVRFLTGHRKDGQLDLDWQNLAAAKETLVFYMGLNGLTEICEGLIAHGMAGDTPAALIERGTRPDQRIVLSDLQQLPFKVSDIEVQSPSLLIIGNVVRLQEKLAWYGETLKKQIARG